MKPIEQMTVNLLLRLQEKNRTQADKVRLLQDALGGTPALAFAADIRAALGDNGKRMQDELIAYCKELVGAQAAVAEMRAALKESSGVIKLLYRSQPTNIVLTCNEVLDRNAKAVENTLGTGWKSPKEIDAIHNDFQRAVNDIGSKKLALEQQLAEAQKDSERLGRLTIKQDTETGEVWVGVTTASLNGGMVNLGRGLAARAFLEYANEQLGEAKGAE